jgi:hypothetical protein
MALVRPDEETEASFLHQIDREQRRVARWVLSFRAAVVTAHLAMAVVFGWESRVVWLGCYAALALSLLFAARRSRAVERVATLGIAAIDVPMIYALQRAALADSENPLGTAVFTLGVMVLLCVAAQLTLQRRAVVAVAVAGAVAQVALMHEAGAHYQWPISTALLVLFVAGATSPSGSSALRGFGVHPRRAAD